MRTGVAGWRPGQPPLMMAAAGAGASPHTIAGGLGAVWCLTVRACTAATPAISRVRILARAEFVASRAAHGLIEAAHRIRPGSDLRIRPLVFVLADTRLCCRLLEVLQLVFSLKDGRIGDRSGKDWLFV